MMLERLQKVLAKRTAYSRRKAEQLIVEGRVSVNGRTESHLGVRVNPEKDLIAVDGREVPAQERKVYYLVNKPPGILCTLHDPQGRPVITDLLKGVKTRVFPVGRLDMDSEGLILLTNDGDTALKLQHPRYGVTKTYEVLVKGAPVQEQLNRLRQGMVLEHGITVPAQVEPLRMDKKKAWLRITIAEGKKRQVRLLCREAGLPVLRLKRVALDGLRLGDLKMGEYRPLKREEVSLLKKAGSSAQSK